MPLIDTDCCEEERLRQSSPPTEDTEGEEDGLTDLANRFIERMGIEKGHLVLASKVKSYAPHVYHYVFDIAIGPA